jgi:hypothetical protein
MMTEHDSQFQTLFEIYYSQGSQFPFWVKPWGSNQSIILVLGWVEPNFGKKGGNNIIYPKVYDQKSGDFIANRYTSDKQKLISKHLIVSSPNLNCWLPA